MGSCLGVYNPDLFLSSELSDVYGMEYKNDLTTYQTYRIEKDPPKRQCSM